jgi:hypothetical protein
MGEIAEMMLDGTLCEGCGVYLGGSLSGPRRCIDCQIEDTSIPRAPPIAAGKIACPKCQRHVKAAGLKDHMRDRHAQGKRAEHAG